MKISKFSCIVLLIMVGFLSSCSDDNSIDSDKEEQEQPNISGDTNYDSYYRVKSTTNPVSGAYGIPSAATWGFVATTASADFYSSLNGLKGAALKSKLKQLVAVNQSKTSYDWERYKESDVDPRNSSNMLLIYTGRSMPMAQQDKGSGNSKELWNREHVFSCSNGGFKARDKKGGSDNHHIRACEKAENGFRGNKILGSGYVPREVVRGDVARMTYYMSLVYDIEASRNIDTTWALKWNKDDKVDDWEMFRNNVIAKNQGNRNPFVDRPELVDFVFGDKQDVVYSVK